MRRGAFTIVAKCFSMAHSMVHCLWNRVTRTCASGQTINRILSKVQESFWSCTHVNSCQNYILYINLHILLNISSKTTQDIQE